jgi:hypothetical protein
LTTTHHAFHPASSRICPTSLTVDLDGVRMNAQLRARPGRAAHRLPVRVDFEPATEGLTLPVFVPAS